ncbi:GNAT family N-acetyltransferase [Pseudaestuariivita sp.]|uniref:GNAT family N-acetyltransferase n=1 Tax=Pseudaestuariivita sp. TaxID=2211669 RepID=UPI004057E909
MTVTFTVPEVTTDRLRLRAPKASDLDAYAAFRASERSKTVGGPYPAHTAWSQLANLIGHWVLRDYGRWMIADKDTDAPLGVSGLYYPADWPEPELAWSVFEAAEGKGIAFEAATAARAYAYETLGWTRLISCVDPANTRSVALARRMGCVEEDAFEHPEYGTLHIWRHPAPEELT